MAREHTPGPWEADTHGHILRQGGGTIAEVVVGTEEAPTTGVADANAKLIAAAPELLEAAEAALLWFERHDPTNLVPDWAASMAHHAELLRQAIAKATSGE